MYVSVTEQLLYTLWQQSHVGLAVFIKQLLIRQEALQGLVVHHNIPEQGFPVSTDQTRGQRLHRLVWDHLHYLKKRTGKISASAHQGPV